MVGAASVVTAVASPGRRTCTVPVPVGIAPAIVPVRPTRGNDVEGAAAEDRGASKIAGAVGGVSASAGSGAAAALSTVSATGSSGASGTAGAAGSGTMDSSGGDPRSANGSAVPTAGIRGWAGSVASVRSPSVAGTCGATDCGLGSTGSTALRSIGAVDPTSGAIRFPVIAPAWGTGAGLVSASGASASGAANTTAGAAG